MTTGSNPNTNHHPLPPRDDRETLSALFDGELPADAMRFAMKRLDHDAHWRDTCGRWQMIGDSLRGEAMRAAPAGFADGVMRGLAADAQPAVVAAPPLRHGRAVPGARGSRLRWFGGAGLAASVAVAAVLALQPAPGLPDRMVAGPDGSAARATAAAPAPAATAAPVLDAAPDPTRDATPLATAVPPVATERSAPPSVERMAKRPPRRPAAAPVAPAGAGEPATAVARTAVPGGAGSPFRPPVDDIVTRPWPRPVLSGTTAGALTVGMGTAPDRSLYPFEPRLPDPPPEAPQPARPQR